MKPQHQKQNNGVTGVSMYVCMYVCSSSSNLAGGRDIDRQNLADRRDLRPPPREHERVLVVQAAHRQPVGKVEVEGVPDGRTAAARAVYSNGKGGR